MLSKEISNAVPRIREYLKSQPIDRAWLFGSCSRGEETDSSDIDLLVDYRPDARITLFTISRISLDLKRLLGREVDVVERGCLLPFAAKSAERDKILIYEGKS